ncbi:hypothetical protein P9239_13930 [Caballeronia sp. LZ062]|uniref:hypothetical protein n=1 Tax=unclassified Caballeronia TaxID=2646786 RepID=UPI002861F2D8|nr:MULTISPECIES: hypothetical protein [unclassified Caballeronia]MDR5854025.1 hypothetical protein [Caballeronia sp. LZ050]MDR5871444.1 hypothetical protein [Caballeronia sp. LZ062]
MARKPRVCPYQVPDKRAAIGHIDPISDLKLQGAFSALLADQDLAHLQKVLRRSLSCDLGGPLLPPSYWRGRIAAITRQAHLSPTQIQTVHRLYLYIDAFEAASATPDGERAVPGEPLAAAGS